MHLLCRFHTCACYSWQVIKLFISKLVMFNLECFPKIWSHIIVCITALNFVLYDNYPTRSHITGSQNFDIKLYTRDQPDMPA